MRERHLMVNTVAPTHEHDCDQCEYICTIHHIDPRRPRIIDAYQCDLGDHVTLIMRYSSEPSDNASYPSYVWDRALRDEEKLALAVRGLVE